MSRKKIDCIHFAVCRDFMKPTCPDACKHYAEDKPWVPVLLELAKAIKRKIILDVTDRRGWRQEWDRFDLDTREEISETWIRIIMETLADHYAKEPK